MQDVRIILEGTNGIHKLSCGDFYLDEANEIMYVGVGAFGGSDGGGIIPVGTIHINTNGQYNVTNFASAVVEVAPYGVGTIEITKNGKISVNGKKTAIVNVPQEVHAMPYTIDVEVKGPVFLPLTMTVQCGPSVDVVAINNRRITPSVHVTAKPSISLERKLNARNVTNATTIATPIIDVVAEVVE